MSNKCSVITNASDVHISRHVDITWINLFKIISIKSAISIVSLDTVIKKAIWGLRGLNSGPYDLQSHALPAELSPHDVEFFC
ncbi:hypothetical protein BB561_003409 [Smittium simulii]|uniref:Uncharacterized protein n=1 Tax=Smittium simulii TaxID=133385 RepID=A0A2T9YLK1_9FUNG|nr:hypothetical protein BB561_003409 [Smittium simulii]